MAVLFRWSQAARSLLVALSGADTALSSSVDFVANDAITRGALSTAFSVSSLQSSRGICVAMLKTPKTLNP